MPEEQGMCGARRSAPPPADPLRRRRGGRFPSPSEGWRRRRRGRKSGRRRAGDRRSATALFHNFHWQWRQGGRRHVFVRSPGLRSPARMTARSCARTATAACPDAGRFRFALLRRRRGAVLPDLPPGNRRPPAVQGDDSDTVRRDGIRVSGRRLLLDSAAGAWCCRRDGRRSSRCIRAVLARAPEWVGDRVLRLCRRRQAQAVPTET